MHGFAKVCYALRSNPPTRKERIPSNVIELADQAVTGLQKARMVREVKAAADRRHKALEEAELRILTALKNSDSRHRSRRSARLV